MLEYYLITVVVFSVIGFGIGKLVADYYWKKYLAMFFESNVAVPLTELNKIKTELFKDGGNI